MTTLVANEPIHITDDDFDTVVYRDRPPVDMMDKPLRALPTSPQAHQQQQGDQLKGVLAA